MIKDKNLRIILASGSPRRKELLGHLGLNFEVIPSDVEEVTDKVIPREVAIDLAMLKGNDIFNKIESDVSEPKQARPFVIASDTIVVIDQKVLGKPKDREHAKEMLLSLSGRKHDVYTSIFMKSVTSSAQVVEREMCVQTEVEFDIIQDDILNLYLDSKDPYDKAGAYGIQNQGLLFVKEIRGSYSNVVGFPLSDFVKEFKEFVGEL